MGSQGMIQLEALNLNDGTIKRNDLFLACQSSIDDDYEGTPKVHRTIEDLEDQMHGYRMTDMKKQIDQQNVINDLGSFAFNPNNMMLMKCKSGNKLSENMNN